MANYEGLLSAMAFFLLIFNVKGVKTEGYSLKLRIITEPNSKKGGKIERKVDQI